uniref:Uncharacterized protein n=1 Tax=Nonomuraea gerenzanensis TaxID=93944 RepID=A0A1M4DX77_9ACTN|nr:hypothetical protein BN4615_P693 [Nonomuraea gerenzanensis]
MSKVPSDHVVSLGRRHKKRWRGEEVPGEQELQEKRQVQEVGDGKARWLE